jgi:CubicO group peptidase (beta-lactamase class C family)
MGLLGHAVEVHSGMTYEEKVLSTVCRPLGMKHTFLTPPAGFRSRVEVKLGPLAPAGGFHSSAADLALFVKAALGMGTPPVLAEDLAITYKPQGRDGDGKLLMLGWQPDEKAGCLYHAGMTHAFIGIDREKKVGAVMILGAGYNGIENIGLAVVGALAGRNTEFPKPRTVIELSPKELAGYAGAYRLDEKGWVVVTVEGDALKLQFMKGKDKGGTALLHPEDKSKFFCREWDCAAEFLPASGANPATAKIRMYSWEGKYVREK